MAKKTKLSSLSPGDDDENDKEFEIAKKQLKGFTRKASEVETPQFITSGHLPLDLAIGRGISPDDTDVDISEIPTDNIGGFALGKIVEISGYEGSGKSSLAYRTVGYAQKKGLKCIWIDTEQSFSHDLARINGVNTDELEVSDLMDIDNPEHVFSAEEIFDKICAACKAKYKVVVLDSVANLATRAELDNNIATGGVGMGELARLLSRSLKKVTQYAAKFGVLIILINQIREKIGVLFGNNETTPGGRTLKFLASLRIKVQKQHGEEGKIKLDTNGKERLAGHWAYIYVMKNRFGRPVEGSVKVPVYYEECFPTIDELLFDAGRALKLIRPRKAAGETVAVFSWGDFKVKGRSEFIAELKKADLFDKLMTEVKSEATAQKFILAPEVLSYKSSSKNDESVKLDDTADSAEPPKKAQRGRPRKGSTDGDEESVES